MPNLLKAQSLGTAENPFPIGDKNQLYLLTREVNEGGVFYYNPDDGTFCDTNATGYIAIANMAEGSYFKLTADIKYIDADVASCAGVKPSGPGNYAWGMLGTENHPFDGNFDGDFHTISGLFVNNTTDCNGFCGAIANHAVIKNLGVVNSYIAGANATGGIVGNALGGTIEKCFFTGTINSSGNYTGGLVGQMQAGTVVSTSYASATITSSGSQLGGIIGKINNSNPACTVDKVYSSCILHGNYQYTGGIVGENINASTNFGSCFYDSQMIDCKVTPNTNPNSTGAGTAMVTTAMANGTWAPTDFTATGSGNNQYPYITGFLLSDDAVLFSTVPLFLPAGASLSDLSTVNTVTVGEVTGVIWTEIERVGIGSFTSPTLSVTGQCYVVLKATKGSNSRSYVLQFDKTPYIGAAENPFPINSQKDLTAFRNGINSGTSFAYKHFTVPALGENTNFLQTADITMPDEKWESIASTESTPFKGVYDGQNYKVTGWTPKDVKSAFFSYIERATIKNLTVDKVKTNTWGALVLSMRGGTVDNCHATGSTVVRGGLVHETAMGDYTCYIKNCTNRNNITWSSANASSAYNSGRTGQFDAVGGILSYAGSRNNYVDNCHNYGNITSDRYPGGVVGRHINNSSAQITISYCSNSGNIKGTASDYCYAAGIAATLPAASSVTYCHNKGNVETIDAYAAGIVATGGVVSYCYNLGDITLTGVGRSGRALGISYTQARYCFNAGKILNLSAYSTSESASTANGISLTNSASTGGAGADVCFNAGDVYGSTGGAYAFTTATTNRDHRYNLGRVNGVRIATSGASYFDETRVPSYSSLSNGISKTTADLTGASVSPFSGSSDWVCEEGLYPRIKGLDTLTISKVLALPIVFEGTDNVDHVSQGFKVRSQYGIVWRIEGNTGAATIGTPSSNYQQVTLTGSHKTDGNIVLAAYKGDSCYYRISLVLAVDAPSGELTVTNISDLQALRTGINSGSAFTYKNTAVPAGGEGTTFKVTADISLSSESNWAQIGTLEYPFLGTFDGGGKTLSGLKQTSGVANSGLFGYVKGKVQNLNLTEVSIASARNGGAVCTYLIGGEIVNCHVKGNFSDGAPHYDMRSNRGGIAAAMSSGAQITNCLNEINITSERYVYSGGIVGEVMGTCYITNCKNAGKIVGGYNNGGISGYGGEIKYCVNYGDVEGRTYTSNVAGVCAQGGTIESCVNSGHVSVPVVAGTTYVAGVSFNGTVKYCYNVGEIEGKNATVTAGVYARKDARSCTQSYNAGKVTGDNAYPVGNSSVTKSFYDNQMTVASTTVSGVTAKSTTDMCGTSLSGTNNLGMQNDHFVFLANMYPRIKGIENTSASWATAAPVFLQNDETVLMVSEDFTLGGCDTGVTWSRGVSTALTVTGCSAEVNVAGLPTLEAKANDTVYKWVTLQVKMDAFIIKDETELANFRNGINSGSSFYYSPTTYKYYTNLMQDSTSWITVPALGEGATFRLVKNLDLGGITWTPIGNTSTIRFRGTFDGDGHSISNFKLSGTYTGLFGYILNGSVHNLTISNVQSTPTGSRAGILAGYVETSSLDYINIHDCSIIGSSSSTHIGALAGQLLSTTAHYDTVANVYLKGGKDGSSNSYVGGFVGYSDNGFKLYNSEVRRSHIEGSGRYVGGVVGLTQHNPAPVYRSITVLEDTIKGTNFVGGWTGYSCWNSQNPDNSDRVVDVIGGTITGNNYVGGILGYYVSVSLTNCSNSAAISGASYVGGIVGGPSSTNSSQTMTSCVNTGNVTGTGNYVGGLFGGDIYNVNYYRVVNCVNAGKVKGNNYVGGISGRTFYSNNSNSEGAIKYCVNIGDVEGNQWVGGVVGESQAAALYSVNAGRVTGAHYVGGIVGEQTNAVGYAKQIQQCLSVGQVYGNTNVGNVVGSYEDGTVTSCYYDNQMSPEYKGVGAIGDDVTGVAEGKQTANMLNTTLGLSSFTAASGLYPRPTNTANNINIANRDITLVAASPVNLINDKTAYTIPGEATYSFTPSTTNGVVWTSKETALRNTSGTFSPKAAGGDVLTASLNGVAKHVNVTVGLSKEFPCIIKNQNELAKFTQYINSGNTFYYNTSASTIDPETFTDQEPQNFLTGIAINPGGADAFFKLADDFNPDFQTVSSMTPIGTTDHPFLGEFNGNGDTVRNLPSATANNFGFFGVNKGVVYNLVIENPNMTGNTYNNVGALCGYNDNGTITNCHVINGTVSGAQNVGGLVGYNKGYMEDCHNSATVSGTNNVGGITGNNTKTVSRCFNLGDVTASGTNNTNLGGVIGEAGNGTVSYCYNAGNITAIGSTSQNVGGVLGNINSGGDISSCYNIGEVTAPTANSMGAVAGKSGKTLVSTVAYDNQMCSVSGAYGSGNGNATAANTSAMTGTALQSVLGNDGTWVYTDGLYPRLASMENMEASIVSATPMTLTSGETVANVEHEFTVGTLNSVEWSVEPATGVLDMTSNYPTINFIRCGTPELSVKQGADGKEIKKVNLTINYTASVVEYDTACGGGSFTWPVNNIDYYATNDVVFSTMENGCPVTHILHVKVPDPLVASAQPVAQQCYNTNTGKITATVTGGFNNYSYVWKNAAGDTVSTSNPATGLAPGTYSLIVTDGNPVPKNAGDEYCMVKVEDIVVNPVTDIVATIDTFSAGCYNAVDGMFQISVEGGVAPYTVSWNNGAGSRFLNTPWQNYEVNNLDEGIYNVKVTDANGCVKTDGLTVNLNEDGEKYVITAFSGSKTYDGIELAAGKFDLKIGSASAVSYLSGNSITLTNGDVLTATVERGDLTYAGEYSNNVTSYSVMRGSQDVTCLYNIEVNHGLVSIAKRPVTLTSADSMAFLPLTSSDGCLRQHKVTVSGDGFASVDESEISYNYSGAICSGHAEIKPNTFKVLWGHADSNSYSVTYNYGTLTLIENGKLVVKALNEERTYDGTTTTYGQDAYSIAAYTVIEDAGGPGVNDTIFYNTPNNTTIEVNGRTYSVAVVLNGGSVIEMTDADTVDNVVTSVHVYEGTGTSHDITNSFTGGVEMEDGVLQVNPIEITLTSYGDTWTYDAQPHSRPGVSVTGAFLPADIVEAPAANRTETNAGKYPNTITYTTSASFKTRNYNIQKNEDTLVIDQRPVYLTGVEKLVDWNNDWQETTDFTYGNLLPGDTASGISYIARGKDIGNYNGVFSGTLYVKNAANENVTANYTPVEQPSFLGIQSQAGEIKMKSATKSEKYSGSAIVAQTYEVSFKGVRINPMASNNKYFKLSTGDTLVINPINDGLTGKVDAGYFTNDFDWDIIPASHKSNYSEYSLDKGTVTITPRSVTLTSNSLTRAYDGTDIVSEGVAVSGNLFVEGEGATYTYESFAAGSRTNAGTYPNKFFYTLNANTKAANYDIDTVYGKLIVSPAELTVTADDKSRPYGDANAFTYTISGYQNGEDESVITAGLNDVTYLCDGDQYANIGTYTITPVVSALVSPNYSFTPATGTLTVQQRKLTVAVRPVTVPYDGTEHNQTTDPTTIAEYTNIADGDVADATLRYTRTAGGSYNMQINSITITRNSGARDVTSNYEVKTSDTSKLNITKRDLKLVLVDTAKIYDGIALKASRYTVDASTPLPSNDVISNVQYIGEQIVVGVGSSSIPTADIVITNSVIGQEVQRNSYEISVVNGKLTVKNHAMTLTVPTAEQSTKTYDATALQPAATVSGQLAGTTPTIEYSTDGGSNWSTTVPSRTDVGSTPVDVRAVALYHDTVTGAYTLTVNTATLTITAKPQTYTYNGAVQGENNATYTDAAVIANKVTVEGLKGSDALTSIKLNGQETNAGVYDGKIVPSAAEVGTKTGNYTIGYNAGKLTIDTAMLTITVIDQTYTYNGHAQGENNATYTTAGDINAKITYTALQTGDAITSITLNGQETNKGEYLLKIVPSVAVITKGSENVTGNYKITYVKGKLTIDKAALAITATDQTYTYNGSAQGEDNAIYTDATVIATKVSVVGLQGDDVLDSIKLNGNETNQGVYDNEIVPSAAVIKNGSTKVTENYAITYNFGKLTINQAALTIKLDTSKLYDGSVFVSDYTATTEGYTITGLVNGDYITSGVVTSSSADVGTYIDSASTNSADVTTDFATYKNIANYKVTYDLKQEISGYPAPISVASLDSISAFDGNVHRKDVYTVTYDGTAVAPDATGLVFTLPTGDKLTFTSTFAGITNVDDALNSVANNNTFTYVLENNDSYVGPRDTT
ncbi:MAG: hypothetical protein J5730_08065, partial [Bacteroidales bacterium]|nr:hypothetical protein [Bacteroidales bacterium]